MSEEKNKKNKLSSEKDCPQCYYKQEEGKKLVEECPQCHYHPKEEEKDIEECPQCHYKFNKK